jgi:hypothetical protein
LRAAENDFEGTRTTIPRARDATGQVGGGVFVRVHAGRGQATFCAGAHRTWSGSLHQRAGAAHAQDADGRWSRRCEDGGSRKSAAHAQDADGQWNRRCEDSVRKRNQSHPLARDDGAVNNDGHQKAKRKLVLLRSKRPLKTLCTKGFRPNYQTTQCNELCIVTPCGLCLFQCRRSGGCAAVLAPRNLRPGSSL